MKIKPLLNKYLSSGMILSAALFLLGMPAAAADKTTPEPAVTTAQTTETTASADETQKEGEQEQSEFYKNFIKGKLAIGTRIVYRSLTDSDSGAKGGTQGSGTYLGTIYALDEEQSYAPTKIFMSYFFTKYLGMELAYDSMEASTKATSIYTDEIKSDGNVSLYGPTISILARIPNSSNFTPYGGFGFGFFSADFDESPDWGLGYSGPSQYESLGSPSTALNGHTRSMEVDSTVAIILTAGVTWDITENWFLDFSGKYDQPDTDASFYSYQNGVQTGTPQTGNFPMDNFALRVGIGYTF